MGHLTIGGITKRSLRYGDLGGVLRIVKGLDMNGGRGVAWGGHDGCGSREVEMFGNRDSDVQIMNLHHAHVLFTCRRDWSRGWAFRSRV